MVEEILIYWILVFIVLLIINLAGNSTTFGILGGFWLLILGLAIIMTGIQLKSGMVVQTLSDSQVVTYNYSDAVLPFSTYSFIWGFFFIGLSMYMIMANGMRRVG